MDIDTSGAYSVDKVYGQLTMPFVKKPVTINAHTPYDRDVTDNATSRENYLRNSKTKSRYDINEIRKYKGIQLDDNLKIDIGIVEMQEFPPESSVNTFNLTGLDKTSDVTLNAIKTGYLSADKAIVFAKAYKAYNSVNDHGDITKYLSSVNYSVS